jgi:hypothetical protein
MAGRGGWGRRGARRARSSSRCTISRESADLGMNTQPPVQTGFTAGGGLEQAGPQVTVGPAWSLGARRFRASGCPPSSSINRFKLSLGGTVIHVHDNSAGACFKFLQAECQ